MSQESLECLIQFPAIRAMRQREWVLGLTRIPLPPLLPPATAGATLVCGSGVRNCAGSSTLQVGEQIIQTCMLATICKIA